MKLEFTISNPSKDFLYLIFPCRNKQGIKKDLRKHIGSKYYNLSIKKKLALLNYWKNVLKQNL